MTVSFEFGYCYLWKLKKVGVSSWGHTTLSSLVHCQDEGIDNTYCPAETCPIPLWWILSAGDFLGNLNVIFHKYA